MGKFRDLTGQRFGRLVIVDRATGGGKHIYWNCICDCGTSTVVRGDRIASGWTASCGCLQRERAGVKPTHGKCFSKAYASWNQMVQRCSNPNNQAYALYGERGIMVCEQWKKFENFYADMGDRPKGLTIERIDNNVGYSPSNCKWATYMEQNRNRRDNRTIKHQGEERCLSEWAEIVGINSSTLDGRLKRHPPEVAFNM